MRAIMNVSLLAALAALTTAKATVLPYNTDTKTLHLWHLDQSDPTKNLLVDEVGTENLYNWGKVGTVANTSISNLTYAYRSSTTAASSMSTLSTVDESTSLMGADGAFTWEMVIRPEEAASSSAGNQLLMHRNGGGIQLKLYYGGGVYLQLWDGVQIAFNQRVDGSSLGNNEYATNEWFHVAVAYDGNGNGTVYWTRLDENYAGTANMITTYTGSDIGFSADQAIGFAGKVWNGGDVFNGTVDEIRISDIARAADDFLQPPEPPPPVESYTADADTLHLWHLNETSGALADSAASLSLYNWGNKGTLGVASYPGLTNGYLSSTTENSCIQTLAAINMNANLMGTDGAFSWEMTIRPDEAADSAAGDQMLMHRNGGTLQLKINYGVDGFARLTLYDSAAGTVFNQRIDDPSLGVHEYAAGEWFHVAVTYDGSSAGSVYWTRIGDSYAGTANELITFTLGSDLSYPTDQVLAFAGKANNGGNNFNGIMDEIRISATARGASAFLGLPLAPDSSPYVVWINGFDVGTSTNLTDNPDSDTLNNLAEFALGGDPSDGNDTGLATTSRSVNGYFEMVHPVRTNAVDAGLIYYVTRNTDLTGTAWTNMDVEVTGTNVTGGAFDYVTNRVPTATHPVQFIKLVIESAE